METYKLINLVRLVIRTLYEQKGIELSLEEVEDMGFERIVLRFAVLDYRTSLLTAVYSPNQHHFSIAVDTETDIKNKAEELEFCKALMDHIVIEIKEVVKREEIQKSLNKILTQSIQSVGLSRETLGIKLGK